ncbi:hypothetical protein PVAP13_8NG256508 [Panicum virgatum]|uniref:Zinc finger GRF-type domain-containing protein n=1 Tax=Panicum virgatum TaxID=38727 RepID=A0A8T0P9Y3_PANVG|nr:hypothetical protein PVAP13_8NG256508 [Panicum virgatum]
MGGMRSPMPYREGPLAYEPAIFCRCDRKAPRWISWSDDNPGRRYLRCIAAWTINDCSFYAWFDGEHTPFLKNLLLDLRDAVWNLRNENAQLKQLNLQGTGDVVCNLRRENAHLKQMNEELQRSNEVKEAGMKAKIKELEDKDVALGTMATMLRSGKAVHQLSPNRRYDNLEVLHCVVLFLGGWLWAGRALAPRVVCVL